MEDTFVSLVVNRFKQKEKGALVTPTAKHLLAQTQEIVS